MQEEHEKAAIPAPPSQPLLRPGLLKAGASLVFWPVPFYFSVPGRHLHRERLCFWTRLRHSATPSDRRYAAHSDYGGHVPLPSILPLTHTSVYQCSAPTCEEVNW